MVITTQLGPFQQHFKEKNVIWWRRKCSSIKTMHGFTHARHRWPSSTNSATNCFLIQHILHLAPCDYFLFPNLKKWFGGKRFITREQLETEAYFEGFDKSYYLNGLKKLKNWIKYIVYWKETMLRNKNNNKNRLKKVYYVFLKTYWLVALVA